MFKKIGIQFSIYNLQFISISFVTNIFFILNVTIFELYILFAIFF